MEKKGSVEKKEDAEKERNVEKKREGRGKKESDVEKKEDVEKGVWKKGERDVEKRRGTWLDQAAVSGEPLPSRGASG